MTQEKSERVPYTKSDKMDLTACQRDMLKFMKNATSYYRFLLCLICSTSFKKYFKMLSQTRDVRVLPIRSQRDMYLDDLKATFQSKDAEDDAVWDAVEAEVDTVEQLEEEAVFDGVSYAS